MFKNAIRFLGIKIKNIGKFCEFMHENDCIDLLESHRFVFERGEKKQISIKVIFFF